MSKKLNETDISLLDRIDRVPEHFRIVADKMESLEIRDFAFYGGAVRDMIAGRKPKDIDVIANMPKKPNGFWKDGGIITSEIPPSNRFPRTAFFTTPHLKTIFQEKGMTLISSGYNNTRLSAKLLCDIGNGKDIEIDLTFNDRKTVSEENLPKAETPSNAMMLLPDGRLYGERDSIEHAKESIHELRSGLSTFAKLKAIMRYEKIYRRIPGMKLVVPEDNNNVIKIWQLFNRAGLGIPGQAVASLWDFRQSVKHLNEPSFKV